MENEIATTVIYENVIYLPYGDIIEATIKQRRNTLFQSLPDELLQIQTLADGSSYVRSSIIGNPAAWKLPYSNNCRFAIGYLNINLKFVLKNINIINYTY